jgi:hypothetical protein
MKIPAIFEEFTGSYFQLPGRYLCWKRAKTRGFKFITVISL